MTCVDFIILKVNGVDISSFPHEDAVRSFLTAEEPIIVEVKRRVLDKQMPSTAQSDRNSFPPPEYDDVETYIPSLVSTAVQTDLSSFWCLEDSVSKESLPYDVDIEVNTEVTLQKCNSEERIGLTVYYSSGSGSDETDDCVEVYIKDIIPKSVADKDGRLRQGDKILQVNGKDVANKEKTESLFAESNKTVTLLVSRSVYQNKEYLKNISYEKNVQLPKNISNSSIEQLINFQAEQLPCNQILPKKATNSKLFKEPHPKTSTEKSPNKKLTEKDLLCNTNAYIQSQMDSINTEISLLHHRMRNIQLTKVSDIKRKSPQLPHIPAPPVSDHEHIYETIPDDFTDSEHEPEYFSPYENTTIFHSNLSKGRMSGKTLSNADYKNNHCSNIETSNCNKPLAFELNCNLDPHEKDIYRSTLTLSHSSNNINNSSIHEDKFSCELCDIYQQNSEHGKQENQNYKTNSSSSSANHRSFSKSQSFNTNFGSHISANTMYTNVANLQQIMLFQQQLLRKELCKESTSRENNFENLKYTVKSPDLTKANISNYQFSDNQQIFRKQNSSKMSNNTRMEWKVKRRKDGTRYIARRPVRNRIIKNRSVIKPDQNSDLTGDTITDFKHNIYCPNGERKNEQEKFGGKNPKHKLMRSSHNSYMNDRSEVRQLDKEHPNTFKKLSNHTDTIRTKNKKPLKDNVECSKCPDVPVHTSKMSSTTGEKLMGLFSVTTV